MKKIPTIFKRNPDKMSEVLNEPNPDCIWVFDGEGVATRKYDGTCVAIMEGEFYKRREVKKGKKTPDGFIEVQLDENTGKRVGWIKVDSESPDNKWHMVAYDDLYDLYGAASYIPDGTYELLGPKINGNPEKVGTHILFPHSEATKYDDVDRTYFGIAEFLRDKPIEGLVFWHPDGRRAKIKKKDFDYNNMVASLRVYYTGAGIDEGLDKLLRDAMELYGYQFWASGYDLVSKTRDLAFDKIL